MSKALRKRTGSLSKSRTTVSSLKQDGLAVLSACIIVSLYPLITLDVPAVTRQL
jgi:hypothetical protein